jgi:Sulfotransferase family
MSAENQTDPLIAFVHIPKAGGMSLMRLLSDTYGEKLLQAHPEIGWPPTFSNATMADIDKKRFFYKAYIGHFAYGIHRVFKRKTRYFSIVREPMERLQSLYNFIKRLDTHHHYQKAQELDMDSFFSYLIEIDDLAISNLQCRMIAGDIDVDLALKRAEEDFELIIPLSRVNEGVALLCDRLKIARREMPVENRTNHLSKIINLRKTVYSKLLELSKGDFLLYRQVCEKFNGLTG